MALGLVGLNTPTNGAVVSDYDFNSADSVYTAEQNIGNVSGIWNINGVVDGDKKSTIDLNGYSGFVISNVDAALNIKNTALKNSIGQVVKMSAGKASFDNVTFADNKYLHDTADIKGVVIYNKGAEITKLSGQFLRNKLSSTLGATYGGVIVNEVNGKILSITDSLFSKNIIESNKEAQGGVIWNTNASTIGDISADFSENEIILNSVDKIGKGGAIFNGVNSTMGNIQGDFLRNRITATTAHGGAIYTDNASQTLSISGDFTENSLITVNEGKGGAIYNYRGQIGNIDGDYVGNYIRSTSSLVRGGAIFNDKGTINNIKGDFIDNYVSGNHAQGGAIQNEGYITNAIQGNFKNNYAIGVNDPARGGAIYVGNNYSVGDIIANYFTGNYAKSLNLKSYGGAINLNPNSVIGNITGKFIGNYTFAGGEESKGGALMIDSGVTIGRKDENDNVVGGIINSLFIGNYNENTNSKGVARGGAIYTKSNLNIIADNKVSEFTDNYVKVGGQKLNEAIYVDGNNLNLTLSAVNNGKIIFNDYIDGQTGYNVYLTGDSTGKIGLFNQIQKADVSVENVIVDFVDNKIGESEFYTLKSDDTAVYNFDIDLINGVGDSIKTTKESSGVIKIGLLNCLNSYSGTPITVQLLKTQNAGLKLALSDNIITIPYIENVIYNDQIVTVPDGIELSTTNTVNDSITINGTIFDGLKVINSKLGFEQRSFVFRTPDDYNLTANLGETASGKFEIIGLSKDTPSTINAQGHSLFQLSNDTELFVSNIKITGASGERGSVIDATNPNAVINLTNVSLIDNIATQVNGSAIYSLADVSLTADSTTIDISGNSSESSADAIFIADKDKTLTLNSVNGGKINLDDSIAGENGYKVEIKGSSDSFVNLNNQIKNANVSLSDITLFVKDSNALATSDFLINSGRLNLITDSIEHHTMNSLNIKGDFKLDLDADLANVKMDRLPQNTIVQNGVSINVDKINLLSDSINETVSVPFAFNGFKDSVKYIGFDELSKDTQVTTAFAPIYKYCVQYNNSNGDFIFSRGTGEVVNDYNPAILSSSVVATVGVLGTMNQTMNYSFKNASDFMNLPYRERIAFRDENKYAISTFGKQQASLFNNDEYSSSWVKSYATFENVGLKNGPSVSNIAYGTLIGFDTRIEQLGNGWDRALTGYIGYNGASQRFSGVDSYQNGGLLGGTMTLYKGNFFNATTISVGASVSDSRTMYGSEDFAMLYSGVGNKTGYNFEFKGGKCILQPSLLLSYTFINAFDYTNAAGVRVDNESLHALQIAPCVKIIGNTKTGWQPYLSVSMVWNAMGKTDVIADGVRLPSMSIKPYVQYGVGVQKRMKDNFMAFGQAMVQNGGRNGVSLTAGFRWALGYGNPQYKDVQKDCKNLKTVKILKQMSPYQKTAFIKSK
ncbi:hypothetical protein J6A34_05770 [bacterium]|nr:hypothetical protein [bacterium]